MIFTDKAALCTVRIAAPKDKKPAERDKAGLIFAPQMPCAKRQKC